MDSIMKKILDAFGNLQFHRGVSSPCRTWIRRGPFESSRSILTGQAQAAREGAERALGDVVVHVRMLGSLLAGVSSGQDPALPILHARVPALRVEASFGGSLLSTGSVLGPT